MAGNRDHFVPRLLLRGFASRNSGKEIYTWVQRKDEKPFETNIINAAVGKAFYEFDGHTDIDAEITKLESKFAVSIQSLRQAETNTVIDDESIPELVVHLSIRTKHLRDSILGASDYVLKALIDFMATPSNLMAMVSKQMREDPKFLEQCLEQPLRELGLKKKQKRMALSFLKEISISHLESSMAEAGLLISTLGQQLEGKMHEAAKQGQLQALARDLVPEPRVAEYRKLEWHLLPLSGGSLILGDSGPFARVEQDFKPLPDKDDVLRAIYLPIGDRHLLAGVADESQLDLEPQEINDAAASCAMEFIVGSTKELVERHATLIGRRGFILSEDELNLLAQEVFSELVD